MDTRDSAQIALTRPETQVAIARVRDDLAELAFHADIDVSERVSGADVFVLALGDGAQPSPQELVVCHLDGHAIPDTPGSGAWTEAAHVHAALYAAHPGVRAIVRTGSPDRPHYVADGNARQALARSASTASPPLTPEASRP